MSPAGDPNLVEKFFCVLFIKFWGFKMMMELDIFPQKIQNENKIEGKSVKLRDCLRKIKRFLEENEKVLQRKLKHFSKNYR